jgi:hypothetical protein
VSFSKQVPKREPWSEEVHFASLHVKYWRLQCAAKANNYDAALTLADVCKLLPVPHAIVDDDIRTDKQNLNAAHRALVTKRLDAAKLRKDFLQELRERIAMRKTSSTLSPEESLKCINKQLRSTANFGRIKKVLKPSTPSPLTKVHVTTTECTVDPITGHSTYYTKHVKVIDTRAELEALILSRNKKHFAQAQGTPFTKAPLKSMRADNALEEYYDEDGAPLS